MCYSLNATWVMAKMRFEDWLMCVSMVSNVDHSQDPFCYITFKIYI